MVNEMTNRAADNDSGFREVLEDIKDHLAQLQFGSLEISVHNGQVVQIERREKKRYEKRDGIKSVSQANNQT
jgi:hypothetical protein